MMSWIEIDGRRSTEFGLMMTKLPLWPVASETVTTTAIPGVAVETERHTGQYQDFPLSLTGYLIRPYNQTELGELLKWIMNGNQLVMSSQPDLYGIIRTVGTIDPSRIGTIANEIKIPFTMQPFKYSRENFHQRFTDTEFTVLNRGNTYCEPVYKLTISDNAIIDFFYVNGEWLKIQSAAVMGKDIYIDVPRKKVYYIENGIMTVCQRYTVGRFWNMVLHEGWNTISKTSDIEAVEIVKNERWL